MLRTAHRALVHNNIMSVQCNVLSTTHYRDVERYSCLKIKVYFSGTITFRVCLACRCPILAEIKHEFVVTNPFSKRKWTLCSTILRWTDTQCETIFPPHRCKAPHNISKEWRLKIYVYDTHNSGVNWMLAAKETTPFVFRLDAWMFCDVSTHYGDI